MKLIITPFCFLDEKKYPAVHFVCSKESEEDSLVQEVFWCFWFSPTSPGWKQMTRVRIVHKQPLACVISAHVLGKVRAKTSLFDLTVSSERTLPCASKEHNGKTQTG